MAHVLQVGEATTQALATRLQSLNRLTLEHWNITELIIT